jgi:hypothetical protein
MKQRQSREIFVAKNNVLQGERCRAPKYERTNKEYRIRNVKSENFSGSLVSDSPSESQAGLFSVGKPDRPQLFLPFLRMLTIFNLPKPA